MLLTVLVHVCLTLAGVPALFVGWMARSGSGAALPPSGGGDLAAAALAEGVVAPPQLGGALNRRMALERGGGTAELWPDAGLAARHFTAPNAQLARVEFSRAGA